MRKSWGQFVAILAAIATLMVACVGLPGRAYAVGDAVSGRGHVAPEIERADGSVVAFIKVKASSGIERKLQTKAQLDMQRSGLSETQKEDKAKQNGRATAQQAEQVADSTFAQLQSLNPSAVKLYTTGSAISGVAVKADAQALRTLAEQSPSVASVTRVTAMEPLNKNSGAQPQGGSEPQLYNESVGHIGAVDAWAQTGHTGQGVNIAVIDTGLDYTHVDFGGPGTTAAYQTASASTANPLTDPSIRPLVDASKYKGGHDFAGSAYQSSSDVPAPDDNPIDGAASAHGTHVAGIAAGYGVKTDSTRFSGDYTQLTSADTDNMKIAPGSAPKAGIYALKVFGDHGGTTGLSTQAIDWVVQHNLSAPLADKISVVSLSLGAIFGQTDCSEIDAINALASDGVLTVAAAGNNGDLTDSTGSPASAKSALSVAASWTLGPAQDAVASFTSRGLHGSYDGTNKPDVSAPGQYIISASSQTGTNSVMKSGTSMATPYTSGTAALVYEAHPGWSGAQVKQQIINTADHDVTYTGGAYGPVRVGTGRIDALAAVNNTVHASGPDAQVVSVGFGIAQVPQTGYSDSKVITVTNTDSQSHSYQLAYQPRTSSPGVNYSLSTTNLTVPAGSSAQFSVDLSISDQSLMRKTRDPSQAAQFDSEHTSYVSDATGIVELTPTGPPSTGATSLRVAVAVAPKPISETSTVYKQRIDGSRQLEVSGHGLNQGADEETYKSQVAPMVLGAESPVKNTHFTHFRHLLDSGDIRAIGHSSTAPQLADPSQGMVSFGVVTDKAWGRVGDEYLVQPEVYLDTNNDGQADYVITATNLTTNNSRLDSAKAVTYQLDASGHRMARVNTESIDDAFISDSHQMVLSTKLSALGFTATDTQASIAYKVDVASGYAYSAVDSAGSFVQTVFDAYHPSLWFGSNAASGSGQTFFDEQDGEKIPAHTAPLQGGNDKVLLLHTLGLAPVASTDAPVIDIVNLSTVDASALRAEVAICTGLNASAYTPASWASLQTALTQAQTVLGNVDASQAEVNQALANLQAARSALVPVTPPANKTLLQNEVTASSALQQADYTAASWAPFATALAAAQSVLADANTTQNQVDAALTTLQSARSGLVLKPVTNKTQLQAEINTSVALVQADYTPATWAPFATALADAQSVFADTDATQQQVDAAYAALHSARTALGIIPANTTLLQAEVNASTGVIQSDYTAASWALFASNLVAAQGVLAAANPTQSQVDAAYNSLHTARLALSPVPANKTALQTEVNTSVALAQSDYTAVSWTPFAAALADAQAALANAAALQSQVDAAYAALSQARNGLVHVQTVSKTQLQAEVNAATALVESDYTPASWSQVATALSTAQTVLANPVASQQQIDSAYTALNTARLALVLTQVNKAQLQAEVNASAVLVQSDYTPASWAPFTAALSAAQTVLANANAPQSQVDAAYTALNTARQALVLVQANKTQLQAEVTASAVLVQADYTAASWTPFASALSAAQLVLANANATQSQVDAAYTTLSAARTALVQVQTVNKAQLQAEVTVASGLVAGDYTQNTWTPFAAALSAAQSVLADATATQAQVDAAYNTLAQARGALVPVPVVNKTLLQAEVASALTLVRSDYVASSWPAFASALSNAQAVLADAAATQAQVNAALTSLQNTRAALVPVPVVNKAALQAEVTIVQTLVRSDYTPASWSALATALTSAQSVLADAAATQNQVDAALTSLQGARAALVPVANKALLQAEVAVAGAHSQADYTATSWSAFATALASAQAVLADADATQNQVDAALTRLQSATAALQLKPTQPPVQPIQPGPVQPGPVQPGPVQPGPVQPVQPTPPPTQPVQPTPEQPGPEGPKQPEQPGPVQPGQDDPKKPGSGSEPEGNQEPGSKDHPSGSGLHPESGNTEQPTPSPGPAAGNGQAPQQGPSQAQPQAQPAAPASVPAPAAAQLVSALAAASSSAESSSADSEAAASAPTEQTPDPKDAPKITPKSYDNSADESEEDGRRTPYGAADSAEESSSSSSSSSRTPLVAALVTILAAAALFLVYRHNRGPSKPSGPTTSGM
ncbi:hypothetical protein KIMH_14490 [Bombiscardovia apis]|uniref:Peptidase S8/S53 domain-containing protein n=1 Tax=Bombiscardovia apis TaxID=2932182 RepID=A0ABM8BEJ3_9BIFI|nr:S8 family serine peptidase [Bombiscardovia apis]BDR55338.1 hypothetical protein KIMH_14490 [Bombiscardovia apis]